MSIVPLRIEELAAAQALLARACAFDPAAQVAEEKLFGPGANGAAARPLALILDNRLVGVAASCDRWLRLLALAPEHRGKGHGSALLAACEAHMSASASGKPLRVLDQPGNYLSPGIDARNSESIAWLERRGYAKEGENCNLLIEVQNNSNLSPERVQAQVQRCTRAGYRVLRQPAERLDRDALWVEQHFSAGWAFEMRRAASASAVHIALGPDDSLVAFAAHDGNNQGLGWFGPTGTLEAHRGQGLAAALLSACLLDIRGAGHSHCQVAWIGPRGFYAKVAGIDGERRFTVLKKDLQ